MNLNKLSSNFSIADAVYLPLDSYLVSEAEFIAEELKRAKIKSIGGIERYIKKEAATGTVTDYNYLGKLAAEIIDKHQKGTPLGKIPVLRHETPRMVINKKNMRRS